MDGFFVYRPIASIKPPHTPNNLAEPFIILTDKYA